MLKKNGIPEETFTLPEFDSIEERTRLCWATLFADNLYDRDVIVVNPRPHEYDNEHILPRDVFIATYRDTDPTLPTYEELLQYARQGCDILCEGTHDPQRKTTYVLWSLPNPVHGTNITTMISYPEVETESERDFIVNALIDAYHAKTAKSFEGS